MDPRLRCESLLLSILIYFLCNYFLLNASLSLHLNSFLKAFFFYRACIVETFVFFFNPSAFFFQNELLDHSSYMLPAGLSIITGKIAPWYVFDIFSTENVMKCDELIDVLHVVTSDRKSAERKTKDNCLTIYAVLRTIV